jgi:glutamate transport system substrate-binding protein
VATYTINDTRKQLVSFAGPYFVAHQDIMVRSDDNSIATVDDLNGKKVCSAQGSTSLTNIKTKAPQADTSITFDTYSKCADALGDGRVQAMSTDNTILAGLAKDSNGKYKLVKAPFTDEPYGVGMKKDATELRNFVNDRLEAIVADGSWKTAYEKTVGTVGLAAPPPPAVDRY